MMYYTLFLASLTVLGSVRRSVASCCQISDIIENSSFFLVPVPSIGCLKVELYAGGKIRIDRKDPTCVAQKFRRKNLAKFDSYIANVATFRKGQLGYTSTVFLVEDESLSDIEYSVTGGGKMIVIMMKFPSCSIMIPTHAPTPSPTNLPTLTPTTNFPTLAPTTRNWMQLGNDTEFEFTDPLDYYFGRSVSLSKDGRTFAVSATGANDDIHGLMSTGIVTVYVFDEDNVQWNQLGNYIYGEAEYDSSGQSVSISENGKKVAISTEDNELNGLHSGHVRIFEYDEQADDWIRVGLNIIGVISCSFDGFSVSLSGDGNTVVIGNPSSGGIGGDFSGRTSVYNYDNDNNTWDQRGKDIYGETEVDESGYSVAISRNGDIVAVGGKYSNHVRMFIYNYGSNDWDQLGKNIDGTYHDSNGSFVTLSKNGKIVAICTYNSDHEDPPEMGHVKVYYYDANALDWVQMGNEIGPGYNTVSMSDSGKIIAVGAPVENSTVSMYTYSENDEDWSQIGDSIDRGSSSDHPDYDYAGYVSLAGDGLTVAVGANYLDDRNFDTGNVRIFEYVLE